MRTPRGYVCVGGGEGGDRERRAAGSRVDSCHVVRRPRAWELSDQGVRPGIRFLEDFHCRMFFLLLSAGVARERSAGGRRPS